MMNGNRPVFVDEIASTFVFPMEFVRFIEVPPKAMAGYDRMGRLEAGRAALSPAYADGHAAEAAAESKSPRSTRTSSSASATSERGPAASRAPLRGESPVSDG